MGFLLLFYHMAYSKGFQASELAHAKEAVKIISTVDKNKNEVVNEVIEMSDPELDDELSRWMRD